MLAKLFQLGVFENKGRFIDYGCGDGKLSAYVKKVLQTLTETKCNARNTVSEILKYDRFMRREEDMSYLSDYELKEGSFDIVVTCSVLEHLIGQDEVYFVFDLLNDQGTFCLHTLICEDVPCDPSWFYLGDDHVTIWTNKAMSILYEQKRFLGCAYHVEAQMWFFFRDREKFEMLREMKNDIPGTWVLSDQFVDYWKQKPYRKEA